MGDKGLLALAAVGTFVMVAALGGLLWATHRLIESGDYAMAAVTALIFLALVSSDTGRGTR